MNGSFDRLAERPSSSSLWHGVRSAQKHERERESDFRPLFAGTEYVARVANRAHDCEEVIGEDSMHEARIVELRLAGLETSEPLVGG
jgi:hypothetical protein